jgi:hypothetical protein
LFFSNNNNNNNNIDLLSIKTLQYKIPGRDSSKDAEKGIAHQVQHPNRKIRNTEEKTNRNK